MTRAPVGAVPRAWPTVLRLALTAEPRLTATGLWALVRGKRVRGWNRLSLAADAHPRCYAAWIKTVEPGLISSRRDAEQGSLGIILLGEGDANATRRSLSKAFGPDIAIFDSMEALPTANRPGWLLPIRAGDRVSPALGPILTERTANTEAKLIYWDEDRMTERGRSEPWIKPDWDPLLFGAYDGLTGSCVVRASLVPEAPVGEWPALLCGLANGSPAPLHISAILTHRSTTRIATATAQVALPPVSISVIIPTRDHVDLLETCLAGLSRTDFPGQREIIIVDNGSTEERTRALFCTLNATGQARILHTPGPFNFAALCNVGVSAAQGDLICLLNNDIDIVDANWLEQMAALAVRDEIGAVGARLLYPDGAIQHAGVALGVGGAAGHVAKGAVPMPGAFAPWHGETRTVSAVTAACLLIARAKYDAVGGMDSQAFSVDFNDVDLCLRLAARGWQSVYCAQATLIHHESRSRGTTRQGTDLIRFRGELAALRARWGTETIVDPYHSTLFRRHSEPCLLAF